MNTYGEEKSRESKFLWMGKGDESDVNDDESDVNDGEDDSYNNNNNNNSRSNSCHPFPFA